MKQTPPTKVNPDLLCSLEKYGLEEVEQQSFWCQSCNMEICDACRLCHSEHEIKSNGTKEFRCACQLEYEKCQKQFCCSFKHTGKTFTEQLKYQCIDCEMKVNDVLCSHCAKKCHKNHRLKNCGTSRAFCDCPDNFKFCSENNCTTRNSN
jgi:hypothetical protein